MGLVYKIIVFSRTAYTRENINVMRVFRPAPLGLLVSDVMYQYWKEIEWLIETVERKLAARLDGR